MWSERERIASQSLHHLTSCSMKYERPFSQAVWNGTPTAVPNYNRTIEGLGSGISGDYAALGGNRLVVDRVAAAELPHIVSATLKRSTTGSRTVDQMNQPKALVRCSQKAFNARPVCFYLTGSHPIRLPAEWSYLRPSPDPRMGSE
jgi:hypothetical protein